MPGFWSSSLFADINVIVQIVFYLVLCAGVITQLTGRYHLHDKFQAPIVVLNIVFIAFVMIPTFRLLVGELPGNLNQIPPIVALIHAGLGASAELLAIYCLLAGFKILPRKLGVLRYFMWATFTLWTATVIFGIGVYITFHLSPGEASTGEVVTEHDADLVEQAATEELPTNIPERVEEQTEEPVTVEPSEEPTVAPPTEEIVAEHEEETIEPAPTEAEATGPVEDTDTIPMDEMISEQEGDAVAVIEPEITGDIAQAQWQAIQPTTPGPGARYQHAMQYNAATNQVFVFGGRDGNQIFNDVWALDMDMLAWRQIAANATVAPPARFSTVMIVDEPGQNLYISIGQTQGGTVFNDVWKLDLATESWTELSPTAGEAPIARYGAPGGNLDGNLVTTHGFGTTRYNDTWRFNTSTGQWENITPAGVAPLNRCLFAAATTSDANLVIHGGCASGFGDCFLDDTWVLDTNANVWREVLSDVKPVGRQHQTLVSGEAGSNQVILFGGQDASRAARNDLWLLDLTTGVWESIEAPDGPEARYQHAAVWIPGQGMLVFGGRDEHPLDDMWLLSIQPTAPEESTPPAAEQTATPEPEPTLTPVPVPTDTPELISEHDGG